MLATYIGVDYVGIDFGDGQNAFCLDLAHCHRSSSLCRIILQRHVPLVTTGPWAGGIRAGMPIERLESNLLDAFFQINPGIVYKRSDLPEGHLFGRIKMEQFLHLFQRGGQIKPGSEVIAVNDDRLC